MEMSKILQLAEIVNTEEERTSVLRAEDTISEAFIKIINGAAEIMLSGEKPDRDYSDAIVTYPSPSPVVISAKSF